MKANLLHSPMHALIGRFTHGVVDRDMKVSTPPTASSASCGGRSDLRVVAGELLSNIIPTRL